ncbi:hypothetical protein AU195_00440 [Mycobacterium sp. IS-1496]|uniref:hypothetical protein n=1 Tax=Mycobacterium sp. IS-1496 TaxID=1772284 RepID=UPI000741789C|nr:hypothetical protein [Mycobacterium sp. IS-1496]KUI33531.1 hypothetical protein AU195_00440 [Mycobacterium sp. IS-1496]
MEDVKRARSRTNSWSIRYGIAAIALCAAVAGAPAPGVAWADDTVSDKTSNATAQTNQGSADRADADKPLGGGEPETADPRPADPPGTETEHDSAEVTEHGHDLDADLGDPVGDGSSDTTTPAEEISGGEAAPPAQPGDATTVPEIAVPGIVVPEPVVPEPAVPEPVVPKPDPVTGSNAAPEVEPLRDTQAADQPVANHGHAADEKDFAAVATLTPPTEVITVEAPREKKTYLVAATLVDAAAPALAAVVDPTVDTAPSPPQPLSPIAELLELPGRLVNAVLEILDFTSSANSPSLPISFAPINDAIFGAFRELERQLGLWRTPAPQPVVPTLTYTGPTDRPTPTVAQFLNASAAGYVLGATPGGLVPLTVDGFQMSSTNVFSGMVGRAWVTPEGQVIIAYQGTTGGSHLLFNPLTTIAQVLADLQVVFTGTTPLAFHDALDFAEEVRAEAALQGYSDEDIFVTGHSLGGWEAQYVAQQTGLSGIGFEAPGINTVVPGNGADSMFVNIGTYGSSAPYMATDLPGLQPFMPPYVPGGGSKPHFGPIVMIGDPAAMTPLYNASQLWGTSPIGSVVFLVDYLMNFFQYHLPGVQAYHLDVTPDPGIVLWLGTARGPVHTGYGTLTIPQLMKAASDDGILFLP